MEFVLKDSIHTAIAETLYNDILTNRSVYHYFIGGSYTTDQQYSTVAEDTLKYELDTRNEILSVKKVTASDVSFVIPRYDWSTGTVYDMFDDSYSPTKLSATGASALRDAMFYVVTDQFNVYKCLFNATGNPSTVKPTGNASSRFSTADGYVWKFMYTIPLSSRNKFLNNKFIPVQTALQAPFYSNGAIQSVQIVNAGTGYTSATAAITGDGTGATATPVLVGGQLVDVIVNTPGNGYSYANITITGNGTGAQVTSNLSVGDIDTLQSNVELLATNGAISAIVVDSVGGSYPSATVSITGDGTGATAVPVLVNGAIVRIDLTAPGSGYTYASVVINGVGTGCVARAVMGPKGGHGKNAVYELFARRLQFYTSIASEKNQGFVIQNDYRQIGIIRNIKSFGLTSRYYLSNGSPLFVFGLNNATTLKDDVLQDTGTGKQFRAYAVNGNSVLVQNLNNSTPLINNTLLNITRGGIVTIGSITPPSVDKFSGDLLMIDNVSVVTQVPDQIITLKTAIKF